MGKSLENAFIYFAQPHFGNGKKNHRPSYKNIVFNEKSGNCSMDELTMCILRHWENENGGHHYRAVNGGEARDGSRRRRRRRLQRGRETDEVTLGDSPVA